MITSRTSNKSPVSTSWKPAPSSPSSNEQIAYTRAQCTPCGKCVCKYVNWCPKYLYSAHTCTCTSGQYTCLVHATLTAKKTRTPAQVRLCDGAATSSLWLLTIRFSWVTQATKKLQSVIHACLESKNVQLNHNDILAEPNVQRLV